MCNLGSSSNVTSTKLPDWLNQAGKFTTKKAENLVQRPYNPYTKDLVADFNPTQTSGFNTIEGVFGGGGGSNPSLGSVPGSGTSNDWIMNLIGPRGADQNGQPAAGGGGTSGGVDPATGYRATNITPTAMNMVGAGATQPASRVGGNQWQSLIDSFTGAGAQKTGGTAFDKYVSDVGGAAAGTVGGDQWKGLIDKLSGTPAGTVGGSQWQNLVDAVGNTDAQKIGGDQWQQLVNQFSGAPAQSVGGGGTLDYIRAAMGAGPQQVGTERVVDQNGRLGAMSDYMDPYVQASLDPTIRRIEEQAAKENLALKGSATSAHAFGDARHGILEASNRRDTTRAISEASAAANENAFNAAMAARTGDLNRFLSSDIAQGQFGEQALGRVFSGAGMELGAQTTNAGLNETALERARAGATDILGREAANAGLAETALNRKETAAQNIMGQETTNANLQETALGRTQTAAADIAAQEAQNAALREQALGREQTASQDILNQQTTQGNFNETALGREQAGANAVLGKETTQGTMNEAAANRLMAGGTTEANLQTQGQNDFIARMQALLGVGSAKQQLSQNELDTAYQQFQNKQQSPYDKLAAMVGAVSGVPYNRTTTNTTNTGGSDIVALLGSLLGAAIP